MYFNLREYSLATGFSAERTHSCLRNCGRHPEDLQPKNVSSSVFRYFIVTSSP
ncbi:uncharacterized protein METZ01_LOCUS507683, partial [marine metagenome]